MPSEMKTEYGTIQLPENVLAILAGGTVEDCAGIVGMASRKASDSLYELLRRENYGRGVRVVCRDDGLEIDIHVIVEYGVSIMAVAESAMEIVRYRMENMTGLKVVRVNVAIDGVRV